MEVDHVAVRKAIAKKSEEEKKAKKNSEKKKTVSHKERGYYRDYTVEQIQELIDLTIFSSLSARKAVFITDIVVCTAHNYISQYKLPNDPRWLPGQKMCYYRGNNCKLKEEHTKFLLEFFDNNPSAVLWEACTALYDEFLTLSIDLSNVHHHLINYCSLTLKKLNKLLAKRNSPKIIKA